MVSEPQVQTLWPNGPTYTQVSGVLPEILFLKMICSSIDYASIRCSRRYIYIFQQFVDATYKDRTLLH